MRCKKSLVLQRRDKSVYLVNEVVLGLVQGNVCGLF
jgi:hypothetical protein